MTEKAYDVVVIGGGSAGYAAARTAASLGARTAVIEGGEKVGGLCILRGCMPSKTLLESAHRWHDILHAKEFGLEVSPKRPRLDKIIARKEKLIGGFADYRREQLTSGNFDFIRGNARFLDAHTLAIGEGKKGLKVTAKAVVVATGSTIPILDIPGLKKAGFITSDQALNLTKQPKSLIVLGGGVIAVELGQFFADIGTKVTVIQRSSHIIKENDDDVCEVLERKFRDQGIKLYTGTKLLDVKKDGKKKLVRFEQDGKTRTARADEIFYALGRVPSTGGLALDAAGVQLSRGAVTVDAAMRTSASHIFAAGDVTGLYEVVHTAIEQGEAAGHNAALAAGIATGEAQTMDYRLKCTVIFTDPEVAQVGMNEKECQAAGIPYYTAQYPFDDHGKSIVMGATYGFVKLVAETKRGEILGAQIVGPHASDLIHELIAVMYYHGTAEQLAKMPHYHPTLAEIITYPAEDIADKVKECADPHAHAACSPGTK